MTIKGSYQRWQKSHAPRQSVRLLTFVLSLLTSSSFAAQGDRFPDAPHATLTPGATCQTSRVTRYPERIYYCERDVSSQQKAQIIRTYDREFGYQVGAMNRQEFKIDHLIPLCAGGSNETANLWPQHMSIYRYTDPIEPLLCERMAEGKLKQKEAIALIKRAKANVNEARQILEYVENL